MDFILSESQQMLQNLARDFAQKEVEPYATELDRTGILPDELIKKCADVGLLGMTVPRKYGGSELGNLSCVLALEQLAYSGAAAWWIVSFSNSIPESIVRFGSEEIKQSYLRPLCEGNAYASIQFTEAETGSDPSMLGTTSVLKGERYILNGVKRFSTFGARDGFAVTYTKDEDGKCTAFVLEKNCPGYTTARTSELMGGGGVEAVDVYFDNVKVPKGNLLGKKGEGFAILLAWASTEKIEQCGVCTGIAQAALDEAVKYVKTRLSRRRPISDMQGIRWMLAEIHSRVEACRWLTYRTAFLQDQGQPDWQVEAAAAKLFVVPTAMEAVELSRRLHGSYGYTKDFKIERLYRAIAGFSAIGVSLEINKTIVGSALVR